MRILFLDVNVANTYDAHTLETAPQGGTESTVTRIAEGLAARGHDVTVGHICRKEPGQGKAKYLPFDDCKAMGRVDAVIGLREPALVPEQLRLYPDARHFLWTHDYNLNDFIVNYPALKGTGIKIICVSRTHKSLLADALITRIGVVEGVTVSFIYNPIPDELQPDSTPVDKHKLVFFSSPHKGLDCAVQVFNRLREFDHEFRLHIANPGYVPDSEHTDPGIVRLGSLTHVDVIREVRSALAVFHPNWVFAETFGLVHAEALAIGTPVLTTPIGATREIVGNYDFILKDRTEKTAIDKLLKWRDERPSTQVNSAFRLSTVLNEWEWQLK